MRTTYRVSAFTALALSTYCLTSTAYAGICNDSWERSSAAATCTLTSPIEEIPPTDGYYPFPRCAINASCLAGGTHPEDPNSWYTREINNTQQNSANHYQPNVSSLVNCQGTIKRVQCP